MSRARSSTAGRDSHRDPAEYDRTHGGLRRGTLFAGQIAPLLESPVLEVGVGTGLVGSRLARLGLEVVGVDVDPGLARRAQRRLRGRIVLGDAFALPFRDSWFAGAVAVWVLHKLAAPERALAEVARVLRPGGRLVVVHGRGGGVALSPAAGLRIESRDMMGEYPRVIFRRS